jgi:ABC-type glycerol-3-phosphate transport system substrate-binding protein
VNSEGEVVRWDIVNGTSGMIFANTEKPQQSWDFMKWWMETETQTSFAYNLQSTYGPEYVWLSANLEAVANSPIEYEDKLVILEQSNGSMTFLELLDNTCLNVACPISGIRRSLTEHQ